MTSRTVPVLSLGELQKQASDDAILAFVLVTHPDLTGEIRLVLDAENYLIDGVTWNKSAFELSMMTDQDTPPYAQFSFPNVNRKATTMLGSVDGPARVEFTLYPSSYFDLSQKPRTVRSGVTLTPIYQARELFLTGVNLSPSSVSGRLVSWDYRQEIWPDVLVTESLLPGAWLA